MTESAKQNINLEGTSTRDLVNDVASITFQTVVDGKHADLIQRKLREDVQAALEIIRPYLVPEKVEVSTDGFSVDPTHSAAGRINGYVGVATVTVKGTDLTTIATVASEIKTMVVCSSKNTMSTSLKRSVETELLIEAIEDFRSKANAITTALGFTAWEIDTIHTSVGSNRNTVSGKLMALGGSMESVGMQQIESGKSTVSASARGSIILL